MTAAGLERLGLAGADPSGQADEEQRLGRLGLAGLLGGGLFGGGLFARGFRGGGLFGRGFVGERFFGRRLGLRWLRGVVAGEDLLGEIQVRHVADVGALVLRLLAIRRRQLA